MIFDRLIEKNCIETSVADIVCNKHEKVMRWGCSSISIDHGGPPLLTHISPESFNGTLANSAEPDQKPQIAASDQVLHCLLT